MFSRLLTRTNIRSSGAASARRCGASTNVSASHTSSLLSTQRLTLGAGRAFGIGMPATRATVTGARTFQSSAFLNPENRAYVDEQYRQWKANPANVHASWNAFFTTGKYTPPPTLVAEYSAPAGTSAPVASVVEADSGKRNETASLAQMIRAYQVRGHLIANVDPLGLTPPRMDTKELEIGAYGFTDADLDREFNLSVPGMHGFLGAGRVTLRQVVKRLKETYTTSIGFEYMHIPNVEQCNFLRERIETLEQRKFSKEEKATILDRLTWADHFERFLALKWSGAKRFGLEGGESSIPGMKAMLQKASDLGVDTVVLGMPHRGRLNVLSTVVRKPLEAIMSDFHHHEAEEKAGEYPLKPGSGDVKYHLGMSMERTFGKSKKKMHLSLLANPSHLEAVDPVVLGKARAKQFFKKDEGRKKTMAVLLHGDAAFAGQGVVWETFSLSDLPDYTTGGVIHLVVNNQIGFTTDPAVARSTPYCTDLAKAVNAPIFHVNGDDPEAVTLVCELAAEWRQKYGQDVVIDLICYRKHGHNEIDEPSFTQPIMYKKIRSMKSSLEIYQQKLLGEGSFQQAEVADISARVSKELAEKFELSKTYVPKKDEWLAQQWEGIKDTKTFSPIRGTGVPVAKLREIGQKLYTLTPEHNAHPRLAGVYAAQLKAVQAGKGLPWAVGEALAYGSLLLEGHHVRLSGQDVERGTFSHRHAVVHDQTSARKYFEPLNHLDPKQAFFSVSNSNLTEFATLGFELGYSLENPNALVLWEAQFGDFANGAQIIIDQFLSSGEDKWLRQSGLTLLLPHGYEGQGPEHSSARLERFLQGAKEHPDVLPPLKDTMQIQECNWQVINPTTPANFFHAMRRQLHRDFRKPLIVMSPKSLFRHPLAVSTFEDMADGTRFLQFIPDTGAAAPEKVRRILLCSGKVYYDLLTHRTKHNLTDVAISRVEQLSPFPFHEVAAEAARFPKAEIVWCQEEPMNMGAWTYVQPRIETALKGRRARYVGRAPSASTAAGKTYTHEAEHKTLLAQAFKA